MKTLVVVECQTSSDTFLYTLCFAEFSIYSYTPELHVNVWKSVAKGNNNNKILLSSINTKKLIISCNFESGAA